jgi:hypothetical protein
VIGDQRQEKPQRCDKNYDERSPLTHRCARTRASVALGASG